jgi:hypothetical protein
MEVAFLLYVTFMPQRLAIDVFSIVFSIVSVFSKFPRRTAARRPELPPAGLPLPAAGGVIMPRH